MSKTIFKAAFTVTLLSVATRIASFLFRIYLSRTIGAESLGIYQIALSVFFLFATLTAGLPLTLSRKTAELNALGENNKEKSYLTASLIIAFIISAVVIGIFCLFSNQLSFLFSDPRCIPLFYILLPSCLSSAVYGIVRGWFWGKKNYLVFSLTEFFECLIRIVLGVIFISGVIHNVSGAYGTAISFTLSDYLCTILLSILFFVFGGRLSKPKGYGQIIKTALPLTAVRAYNSLVNSLIAIIVPALLIFAGFDAQESVAGFGRAMGMALPLLLTPGTITGAIATVLVPEIASLNACGKSRELNKKLKNSLTLTMLCACFFVSIFAPLGEEIGVFFYGDKLAGRYVSLSAIIMLPMAIHGITSTMLDSLGLELKTMRNYIIGSIFLLLALLTLTKYIGTYAIAVGFGLNYTVTGILNLSTLKNQTQIKFRELGEFLLVNALTVGLCAVGGIYLKNLTATLPVFWNIAIPSVFITVTYFTVNLLFGYVDIAGFYKKRKKSFAN